MATANTKSSPPTDLDVFLRLLCRGPMTRALARELLKLDFTEAEHERAHELAVKNKDGTITPAELRELDTHIRVGLIVSTLQSRARMALKATTSTGSRRG